MNTRKLPIMVYLLFVSILLSNCGPGQLPEPTITPSSTRTSTQTPTSTPIPTQTLSPTPTIDLTATVNSEMKAAYDLEKLATEFCKEKKIIPESAAYDPTSLDPPILICDLYSCWPISDHLTQPVSLDLTTWTPKSAKDIQLILCVDMSRQRRAEKVGYCNYSSSGSGKSMSVPSYRSMDHYDLYETKTGNKLGSFHILGNAKSSCPTIIDSTTKEIIGYPDNTELFKQLSTSMHIPIPTPTPPVYTLKCEVDLNLDQGYLSGTWGFTILGEQYDSDDQRTDNDIYKREPSSGNATKTVIVVDETRHFKITGHTYTFKGTVTVSTTDPKVSYDITATGSAFTVSPQTCTYP